MKTTTLFTQLLNIHTPYSVELVEYKTEQSSDSIEKSVHIYISVDTSPVYRPTESTLQDYEERTWRHLNLFQYPCYLHCRVPKYKDKETGKTKTLEVPWAKSGSGFTLLFEEFALELVKLYGN